MVSIVGLNDVSSVKFDSYESIIEYLMTEKAAITHDALESANNLDIGIKWGTILIDQKHVGVFHAPGGIMRRDELEIAIFEVENEIPDEYISIEAKLATIIIELYHKYWRFNYRLSDYDPISVSCVTMLRGDIDPAIPIIGKSKLTSEYALLAWDFKSTTDTTIANLDFNWG